MILDKVKLTFDPTTSRPEIQAVFANDLARTIWLAVRQGHLVNQFFETNCIRFSGLIASIQGQRPLTVEVLLFILSSGGPEREVIGHKETEFVAELLPFINGEKTIQFEVITT
jgi:hypothetical protein